MPPSRRSGEVVFNSNQDFLRRCGLDLKKLVAIATNGVPCMTNVHQGVVARLRVPLVENLSFVPKNMSQ